MPQTLDESNGSPSPSPSLKGSLRLGFRPATPDALQPTQLPSPSPSLESLDEPEDLAGSDSGDEWDAASYPESPEDTSSPASTPGSDDAEAVKVELFREEELRLMARAGVATAGEKAHDVFAATDGQRTVGLYLTDEQDQAQIGDPLASIAARHQGVAGKVNPDTKDLLSAMVGLFGYATKQINRRTEARALDAGAAGLAGSPQPMPQAVDL